MQEEVELSKKAQERLDRINSAKGRKTKKLATLIVALLILAAVIYGLVIWNQKAQENKPGEAVADLGAEHILPGQSVDYNSNPPTSGPHLGAPANWGIYTEAPLDEQLVHNLEHGGIWISYRDPDNSELVKQLTEFAEELGGKIILAPRPENDSFVAVAAWERLLELDEFDKDQIEEFYRAFINRGPEQVPF